jgi:hypothetical protein
VERIAGHADQSGKEKEGEEKQERDHLDQPPH